MPLGFAGGLFDADTGLTRFVWRAPFGVHYRSSAPVLERIGRRQRQVTVTRVDDPMNRVDMWGLEDSWWDGAQKVGDGLGQLWDKAPGGIGQAVSDGTKGAGEALSKTTDTFATNEDLQKYTGIALGAGALPIALAGGAEVAPIIATTVARNPEKVEQAYDFLSGAFVPGPPAMTWGGVRGGGVSAGLDYIKGLTRNE